MPLYHALPPHPDPENQPCPIPKCLILKAAEPFWSGGTLPSSSPLSKLPFLSRVPPASFPGSKPGLRCSNEDVNYVSYILKTGPLLMDDSGFLGKI